MQDINRGKLAAMLTAVEQGSTLTKSTICTIAREILESEFYEEPDADWPAPAPESEEPEDGGTPESGEEPSDGSDGSDRSDIVKYGRDLAKDGALGIREIITGVMERFGLSNVVMARALGIGHSTLSKYLRHCRCRNAVVTAAAALWGDSSDQSDPSDKSDN